MIELLCTLTGIIAGVAVVASLIHYQGDRTRFETQSDDIDPSKIRGIADQLQVISHRVAANVSAHSEKVEHFSGKLNESDTSKLESILSTIQEIMQANESMQGQLVDAQKRIAQQSQMIEQASQQARTDALTGLANRRALDEFLANCVSQGPQEEVIGLLLMDIDHFKSFYDIFGHTTGDAVLASFARAIAKCCGQDCYAARFGGEEFAVILLADSQEQLAAKAADIRYYVSEQIISYEDLQLKITASAGMCVLVENDNISSAYERADEGLYQSKKSGRNCGYWLGDNGWTPFPTRSGEARVLAETQPAAKPSKPAPPSTAAGQPAAEPAPAKATPNTPVLNLAEAPIEDSDWAEDEIAAETGLDKGKPSEIVDLKEFLGKLESCVVQLRRAELPASALMVEASGLSEFPAADVAECWDAVVGMTQLNLRGIDVVCLYRPFTLCIFMPGCSLDAALERAVKIQRCLDESRDAWDSDICPDKLSVSIAGFQHTEEVSHFLDRLEAALDEAQDASENEVVVHNGDSCHFQRV